jgi:hypothetical protein
VTSQLQDIGDIHGKMSRLMRIQKSRSDHSTVFIWCQKRDQSTSYIIPEWNLISSQPTTDTINPLQSLSQSWNQLVCPVTSQLQDIGNIHGDMNGLMRSQKSRADHTIGPIIRQCIGTWCHTILLHGRAVPQCTNNNTSAHRSTITTITTITTTTNRLFLLPRTAGATLSPRDQHVAGFSSGAQKSNLLEFC